MHSSFLDRFNDTVIDVPAEDMYYLLNTFSSMALARSSTDLEFIRCITIDLFKVGFTNIITKDNCYKIVRDLLVNITIKYTDLLSNLSFLLKENFKLVILLHLEYLNVIKMKQQIFAWIFRLINMEHIYSNHCHWTIGIRHWRFSKWLQIGS